VIQSGPHLACHPAGVREKCQKPGSVEHESGVAHAGQAGREKWNPLVHTPQCRHRPAAHHKADGPIEPKLMLDRERHKLVGALTQRFGVRADAPACYPCEPQRDGQVVRMGESARLLQRRVTMGQSLIEIAKADQQEGRINL
jgi:hypothetical protein